MLSRHGCFPKRGASGRYEAGVHLTAYRLAKMLSGLTPETPYIYGQQYPVDLQDDVAGVGLRLRLTEWARRWAAGQLPKSNNQEKADAPHLGRSSSSCVNLLIISGGVRSLTRSAKLLPRPSPAFLRFAICLPSYSPPSPFPALPGTFYLADRIGFSLVISLVRSPEKRE